MSHQDGRPQVENLFARELTPNLQLVCWDKPSDPTVIAYQAWASDALDEKRPKLSVMDERHIFVESFPDFGDGRHWLRVHHDLPAVSDSIFNVRAINEEHHGDPPTHTHFAANYDVSIDAQRSLGHHDGPPLIVKIKVSSDADSEVIEISRDTDLSEVTLPHRGSIEELASRYHHPRYSLTPLEGDKTPIARRTVVRTADRQPGGNFQNRKGPSVESLVEVMSRPATVPAVKMSRAGDGLLSVTPYAEVVFKADRVGADGDMIDPTATISGDGMDPITARLTVIGQWIDDQGRHSVLASAEGQVASQLHSLALAADRRSRGESAETV